MIATFPIITQETVAPDETLLTFKEVQNALRVSRSTLYRLIWSGKMPRYYVGSTMRFYQSDVQKCVVRQG